jgi:hypothetical protein
MHQKRISQRCYHLSKLAQSVLHQAGFVYVQSKN